MKYKLAVCGGTFDLFHKGHKKFLISILEQSEKLILGLTSDRYVADFKNITFENYKERKGAVEKFIDSISTTKRVEIVSIGDVYGPLLDKNLNAEVLFVTAQTASGAEEINKRRESLGLSEIKVESIEMERAEDGELISSSRIRNGEIDREGGLFIDPRWTNKALLLPNDLRGDLAKPFGEILTSIPDDLVSEKTITIGDVTTHLFNEKNIEHKLSVVDLIVKREKKFDQLSDLGFTYRIETQIVINPASQISWELIEAIKKSLSIERSVILVNGEEDLAVLPAVLIAPIGFTIYYGQPNEGLVQVVIDENTKRRAKELANKFVLS